MTETQTASRFQVLPVPQVSPGKCACCGSVNRPVVDFGFDVDYYGTVYLCKNCVCEAATRFDMVPFSELEQERIARFNAQVVEGRIESVVKEYLAASNELWDRFNANLYRAGGVEPGVVRNIERVPAEQITIDETDESSNGTAGQEFGASFLEGTSGLSSDPSDDNGFKFD